MSHSLAASLNEVHTQFTLPCSAGVTCAHVTRDSPCKANIKQPLKGRERHSAHRKRATSLELGQIKTFCHLSSHAGLMSISPDSTVRGDPGCPCHSPMILLPGVKLCGILLIFQEVPQGRYTTEQTLGECPN